MYTHVDRIENIVPVPGYQQVAEILLKLTI